MQRGLFFRKDEPVARNSAPFLFLFYLFNRLIVSLFCLLFNLIVYKLIKKVLY